MKQHYLKKLTLLAAGCFLFAGIGFSQYCTASYSNITDDWISNVTFAGINNNSISTNYTDYTSSDTATVLIGGSYPISVSVSMGNAFGPWDQYVSVWIDWDNDQLFEDATERYNLGFLTIPDFATMTITGTINVPASATVGFTRMRVIESFNSYAPVGGCVNSTYGEPEDYLVEITSVPCSSPVNAGTAVASTVATCPADMVDLSLNGASIGLGMTYQWQSSSDNVNWSNITGATSATYSTTQTTATYYRAVLTCSGGTSANSTSVFVDQENFTDCYCTNSYATSISWGYIQELELADVVHISPIGCGQTYTNTGLTANVFIGQTYNFDMYFGNCSGGNYSGVVKVFIDFNMNGDFSDPGEEVFVQTATYAAPYGGTISIPATATAGVTGMRVIAMETGVASNVVPCGTYGYGETEDYLINIQTPPVDDAGIAEITSPAFPDCEIDSNISVILTNSGSDTLFSATINWSVNGGSVTTFPWTGAIPPFSTGTVEVNIGTYAFATGDNLEVYTSLPNGVPDSYFANDTISILDMNPSLNGIYDIPGDFASFTDAVTAMVNYGICGPVIFDVATGTYPEQLSIPEILGASAINTVTFRSAAQDSTAVTLEFDGTSTDNYVVRFDGADHIRFEHMTIENLNTTYGRVFVYQGGTDDIVLSNNVIATASNSTTSDWNALVYAYYNSAADNHFTNNVFENGSYGIYFYANSSDYNENTVVEGNVFTDQYYMGISLNYQENPFVKANTVTSNSTLTYGYGMYVYYANGLELSHNHVYSQASNYWPQYGLYLYETNGTLSSTVKIFNNLVAIGTSTSTSLHYGMYLGYSDLMYVTNNTFTLIGGSTTSRAFYPYYSNNSLVENNLFSHMGTGYAAYLNYGTGIDYENNNYYSTGTYDLYYNGSNHTSLESFAGTDGHEENGLNVNPNFTDVYNGMLCNDTLDMSAVPYAWVVDDIYGTMRHPQTPDRGAVEFTGINAFTLGPDQTVCGSEIELSVTGGSNVNAVWTAGSPHIGLTFTANESTPMPISILYTNECGSATDEISLSFIPDVQIDDLNLCDGDVAVIEGEGTAGQYMWSNGETSQSITVSGPGTYSVTYTEGNCTSTDEVTVTQSVPVMLEDLTHCQPQATLNATIPNGQTYIWNTGATTPSITANQSNTYSVTVIDSFNCSTSDTMELYIISGDPQPDFMVSDHSVFTYYFDASNTTNVGPGTEYYWDFDGNGVVDYTGYFPNDSAVHTYPFNSDSANFVVNLEVNNTKCNKSKSAQLEILVSLGVEEMAGASRLSVYPNPTTGLATLVLPKGISSGDILVTDVVGRQVMAQRAGSEINTIDLSGLATGTYNVLVVTEKATFHSKVVLK